MATASHTLTLAEFDTQFAHLKPYYEFWNGEAIQKSMPTWVHGLIQGLSIELLRRAGYRAASDVKLKISPSFHPVPDIIATKGHIQHPYPTTPLEIVIEILSEDDTMSRLLTKCRTYQDWGFQQIYVVDPAARLIFRWSENRLEETTAIAGQPADMLWSELDQ
jgi:Uma2 family endonuclease